MFLTQYECGWIYIKSVLVWSLLYLGVIMYLKNRKMSTSNPFLKVSNWKMTHRWALSTIPRWPSFPLFQFQGSWKVRAAGELRDQPDRLLHFRWGDWGPEQLTFLILYISLLLYQIQCYVNALQVTYMHIYYKKLQAYTNMEKKRNQDTALKYYDLNFFKFKKHVEKIWKL